MTIDIDLFDSANQKFDPTGSGLSSTSAETAIKELDAKTIAEAPNDNNRTSFRNGTVPEWAQTLRGYGDYEQATATSGALTVTVNNGNRIFTDATSSILSITLNAGETSMDATWILKHNNFAVGFPASFIFPNGVPPSPAIGDTWILGLFTRDGGTNWYVQYRDDYTSP